jgi:hypothetical protein
MTDNFFEKLREEEKKARKETIKRRIFFSILLVIFAIVVISLMKSSMNVEDVYKSLKIVSYRTQWVDKEVTPFEISLVPAIWIKLENIGTKDVQYLQLNGRFEFCDTQKPHSSGSIALFKEPLAPGEVSEEVMIKADFGYKASSREAFIKNKDNWREMQVLIFARYQGSSFVRIGDTYKIARKVTGIGELGDVDSQKALEDKKARTLDIEKSIEVISQDSIWVDKKATTKVTIIVPQLSFKIRNNGKKSYESLVFKGVFLFKNGTKLLGEGYNTAVNRVFSPKAISDELIVRSDLGYSASTKKAFFTNSFDWKEIKVRLFVKSMDTDYALLGLFPIKKKIKGVRVVYK